MSEKRMESDKAGQIASVFQETLEGRARATSRLELDQLMGTILEEGDDEAIDEAYRLLGEDGRFIDYVHARSECLTYAVSLDSYDKSFARLLAIPVIFRVSSGERLPSVMDKECSSRINYQIGRAGYFHPDVTLRVLSHLYDHETLTNMSYCRRYRLLCDIVTDTGDCEKFREDSSRELGRSSGERFVLRYIIVVADSTEESPGQDLQPDKSGIDPLVWFARHKQIMSEGGVGNVEDILGPGPFSESLAAGADLLRRSGLRRAAAEAVAYADNAPGAYVTRHGNEQVEQLRIALLDGKEMMSGYIYSLKDKSEDQCIREVVQALSDAGLDNIRVLDRLYELESSPEDNMFPLGDIVKMVPRQEKLSSRMQVSYLQ